MDVELLLREIPEVAEPAVEYQLVRTGDTSALRVRVEARDTSDELWARVADVLTDALEVPIDLELLPSAALPRPSYKPLRVVDE
jgi:phenylacetate-coenzyme A ligase PaaK-like adenylate-forming protein